MSARARRATTILFSQLNNFAFLERSSNNCPELNDPLLFTRA